MKITIELVPPPDFYQMLNVTIPSTIEGSRLILDKAYGQGGMNYIQLQQGLYVNQMDLQLNHPLILNRKARTTNDYFILNFHLSKSAIIQKTEGREINLGFENINILLSSACAEADIILPSNTPVKIFNIGFTLDWVKANIHTTKYKKVLEALSTNKPIYLSETIDFKFKKNLNLATINQQSGLTISLATFQLLDYFFEKISAREFMEISNHGVNKIDFTAMLKVRETIERDISNTIPINDLAKMAGMSISKFKRLFKQIFGITPYQYYLAHRMEKSFELLESKKYSVTEVSFMIGYSNPSQFTKAFQNHFGVLPSEIG